MADGPSSPRGGQRASAEARPLAATAAAVAAATDPPAGKPGPWRPPGSLASPRAPSPRLIFIIALLLRTWRVGPPPHCDRARSPTQGLACRPTRELGVPEGQLPVALRSGGPPPPEPVHAVLEVASRPLPPAAVLRLQCLPSGRQPPRLLHQQRQQRRDGQEPQQFEADGQRQPRPLSLPLLLALHHWVHHHPKQRLPLTFLPLLQAPGPRIQQQQVLAAST
mmetsp:Transcript_10920/g.23803  ORF Transcript_10920/g.23803 Transcript_10920/m.23803 type:complete len:222 (-) Transcript_10920:309-974(-)